MSCIASVLAAPGRGLASLGAATRYLGRRIVVALMVRAERRRLLRLDEAALKDMGFNKGQAHGEAGRTFWDVPVDRMRG